MMKPRAGMAWGRPIVGRAEAGMPEPERYRTYLQRTDDRPPPGHAWQGAAVLTPRVESFVWDFCTTRRPEGAFCFEVEMTLNNFDTTKTGSASSVGRLNMTTQ
jgi:hypothetical protein